MVAVGLVGVGKKTLVGHRGCFLHDALELECQAANKRWCFVSVRTGRKYKRRYMVLVPIKNRMEDKRKWKL